MQYDPNNMTPEEQAAIDAIMEEMLKDELRQLRGDVRISDIPGDAPPSLSNPNSERDDLVASLLGPKAGEMSRDLDSALSSVPDVAYSAIGGPMIEEGSKQAVHGTRHGDISEALAGFSKMLAPAAMPTRAFAPAYAAAGALELNNRDAFSPTEAYASGDQGALDMVGEKYNENKDILAEYGLPVIAGGFAGRHTGAKFVDDVNKASKGRANLAQGYDNYNDLQPYLKSTGDNSKALKRYRDSIPQEYRNLDANHYSLGIDQANRSLGRDFAGMRSRDEMLSGAGAGVLAGQAEDGFEFEPSEMITDALLGAGAGRMSRNRSKEFDLRPDPDVPPINLRGLKKAPVRRKRKTKQKEEPQRTPAPEWRVDNSKHAGNNLKGGPMIKHPPEARELAKALRAKGVPVKEAQKEVKRKTGRHIPTRTMYHYPGPKKD